jgi:hypothetical protein
MRSFVVFSLLLSLSFLFVSCSQESGITSPNLNNTGPMAKAAAKVAANLASIPTVKINHTIDTVITLPKSKKTITISKSVSTDKISSLDDYLLSQNELSKSKSETIQNVNPNLKYCQYEYDTVTIWTSEFQYRPMSGKSIGIFNDLNLISYSDALNIYGFSLAGVQGFGNIASAFNAGFPYSNILVEYLNPTSALATLQSNPNLYPKCGYYEIDEPLKNNYSSADTKSLESLISSWNIGARVILTDYNWPDEASCNLWSYDAGAWLAYYQGVNYYIMCDDYAGNSCGSVVDFWQEYSGYYSPSHVISGILDNVSYHESTWDGCFQLANNSVPNYTQVWLWAGTGDVSAIQLFVGDAWSEGWLQQFQTGMTSIYINTSTDCNPNGPWSIVKSYSAGTRWVIN